MKAYAPMAMDTARAMHRIYHRQVRGVKRQGNKPQPTPDDLHGQDASMLFGLEGHGAGHSYQGGPSSMQGVSGFNPPLQLGSHLHGSKLQSSSNYGGGQYAKYGKRF